MRSDRSRLAAAAFCLLALDVGCRQATLAVYDGAPLPLGREIPLVQGRYEWAFAASPGDRFRVRVRCDSGAVTLSVGSDRRGGDHDEDDATDRTVDPTLANGSHAASAELRVGPRGNSGWINVSVEGSGTDPLYLWLERPK